MSLTSSRVQLVRERAPLRLSIDVETPTGRHTRWGPDEPLPDNVAQDLSFSTTMPGGFEQLNCVLERDPARDYPDLEELSTVTVYGAGAQCAWQGRLEASPETSGTAEQIAPQCSGWQAALDDDQSAREIYVDINQADWGGASIQRQIDLQLDAIDETDATTGPDYTSGQPSITTQLSGPWSRSAFSEAWYDGDGIDLGQLYFAWKLAAADTIGDDMTATAQPWTWACGLSTDDVASSFDWSTNLIAAGPTGSGTVTATIARAWAFAQLCYTGPAGTSGVNYPVFWTMLALYGTHGCPLQGSGTLTSAPGLLCSDVLAHALGKWCPELNFTTGPNGTIAPSAFVIPQLVFQTPGGVSAILTGATAFELPDWAVWERKMFYCYPRGPGPVNRSWLARVGPAALQETGPSMTRLYNGVIVTYTDVSGIARSVGPPGSGCTVESPLLLNTDPLNPANQAGIRLWSPPLQMGTSTSPAAIQVGQVYLREVALLDTSGQATLTGYVLDSHGVLWPAWMVRAGDEISFVDASDPSPRRCVSTSYDDTQKANTVQLDSPPDGFTALLARLSVSLASTGFS